ncbi:SWI SNF, matrix associated, actin dependent regulator of chromatin, sub b, member 1 [Boothiomyces macroporosus]|uniref:SWI SNF, matrix associated, actin dependent regulator of chromatin, sub b, member 1 n=1 Tax=Boothiomyces macroporosus TaxID=261099 RepID=A0AAD5Y492_9FUNG|nr:SWI SNF, matrix associated, actin dependent regulator of chromatin, sub b, member 1 [Boothiomyces macroporosus]
MDEYTKHQLQIPYSKNPSYTPTIHPPSFYYQQSLLPSYLIPVRIDLEYDNVKLSDCFIWNYNEVLITPEDFALQMQKEMDLPKVFIEMIAGSIREQVLLYRNAVEDDTVDTFDNMVLGVYGDKDQEMEDTNQDRENKDQGEKEPNSSEAQQEDKQEEAEDKQENNTEEDTNDKPDENDDQTNVNEPEEKYEIKKQSEPKHGFGDIRIVIKLDIHVGSLYLKDQFEWPLFHQTISPEQFAIQLATELGIGGLETLKEKRQRVSKDLQDQQQVEQDLIRQISDLNMKLDSIKSQIQTKHEIKQQLDLLIRDTEQAYLKIVESSQTLLQVLQKESNSLKNRI